MIAEASNLGWYPILVISAMTEAPGLGTAQIITASALLVWSLRAWALKLVSAASYETPTAWVWKWQGISKFGNNLAVIYMSQGRFEEARREFQVLLELSPDGYPMAKQLLEYLRRM